MRMRRTGLRAALALMTALCLLLGSASGAFAEKKAPYYGQHGTAKHIDGRTVVVSIFADDAATSWNFPLSGAESELYRKIHRRLGIGLEWLEQQTMRYGVGSGFVADGRLDEHSERVPESGEVWNLPFEDTIVDACFSTRWVVKRYKELTGKDVPGAKEVAQAVPTEPEARQLFREYGERLAAFVSPWLEKFGADTLVLGGNISRNYALFCEPLLAGLPEGVEVRTSQLLDQAAMIGAASLFKDE